MLIVKHCIDTVTIACVFAVIPSTDAVVGVAFKSERFGFDVAISTLKSRCRIVVSRNYENIVCASVIERSVKLLFESVFVIVGNAFGSIYDFLNRRSVTTESSKLTRILKVTAYNIIGIFQCTYHGLVSVRFNALRFLVE